MKEKSKVQMKIVLNKRMTQRNNCYYANLTLVIQWRFIEKKEIFARIFRDTVLAQALVQKTVDTIFEQGET